MKGLESLPHQGFVSGLILTGSGYNLSGQIGSGSHLSGQTRSGSGSMIFFQDRIWIQTPLSFKFSTCFMLNFKEIVAFFIF